MLHLCCEIFESSTTVKRSETSTLEVLYEHSRKDGSGYWGFSWNWRAIALELAAQQGVKRLLLRSPALSWSGNFNWGAWCGSRDLAFDLTQPEVNIVIARLARSRTNHLLVNCAGVAHQLPLQSQLPNVQQELAINLVGMYAITRLVARRMAAQREGKSLTFLAWWARWQLRRWLPIPPPSLRFWVHPSLRWISSAQYQVIALLPSLTDTDMVRELQWFRWVVPHNLSKWLRHSLLDCIRNHLKSWWGGKVI